MIREVTTYQAVCDRCGRKTGRYNSMEKLNANGDFWAWVEIDGKLYCPDCQEYDEQTHEYKPKAKEAAGRMRDPELLKIRDYNYVDK